MAAQPYTTQDEDTSLSLSGLWHTWNGKVTITCELLALLAMSPFILMEAATFSAYDLKGWANVWNLLDILTYVLQVRLSLVCVYDVYGVCVWRGPASSPMCCRCVSRVCLCVRAYVCGGGEGGRLH